MTPVAALSRTIAQIRILRSLARPRPRRKPPRQLYPRAAALEYFKSIREYLDRARRLLERELFPFLAQWIEEERVERGDSIRADREGGKKVNRAIDKISKEFFDSLNVDELERLAGAMAGRVSAHQRAQLGRQIRALVGVDVFAAEPNLAPLVEAFTAENVALIKSIPNGYLDDVEKRVTAAMRSGLRWEELAKELQERYEVSEARAALIARDQAGKFFGELNEARQAALGVREFIWRTANDERVRDEHAALEGERFSWDDPPSEGIPGEAINCRCFAEPVLDEILEQITKK